MLDFPLPISKVAIIPFVDIKIHLSAPSCYRRWQQTTRTSTTTLNLPFVFWVKILRMAGKSCGWSRFWDDSVGWLVENKIIFIEKIYGYWYMYGYVPGTSYCQNSLVTSQVCPMYVTTRERTVRYFFFCWAALQKNQSMQRLVCFWLAQRGIDWISWLNESIPVSKNDAHT